MDFFERYPLLLILVIIVTVEGWAALKTALARVAARHRVPWLPKRDGAGPS